MVLRWANIGNNSVIVSCVDQSHCTLNRYKVVCADGALVREGPSLSSAQVQELPQQSIIEVQSATESLPLIYCMYIAAV
jgi:hypothetical protein